MPHGAKIPSATQVRTREAVRLLELAHNLLLAAGCDGSAALVARTATRVALDEEAICELTGGHDDARPEHAQANAYD
jgi:hypothetical protein